MRQNLTLVSSLGLLALVLGVLPRYLGLAGTDVAWLLYVAEQVLGGTDLYGTIYETNPPLAVWAMMPAVWLAQRIPLSALSLFYCQVVLGVLLVVALCFRQLADYGVSGSARWTFTAFALLALLMAPLWDFGQREHLAAVLVLPYVLSLSLYGSSLQGPGAGVGTLAGIGLALKPHFLLIAAAIEGWLWFRDGSEYRRMRRSNVAVVLVYGAYGLSILLFEADYFRVVRELVLPYYGHVWPRSWTEGLTLGPALLTYAAILGAYLAVRARGTSWWRHPASLFAAVALTWLGVAVTQEHDFAYHYLPPVLFGFLASGVSLVLPSLLPALRSGTADAASRVDARSLAAVAVVALMTFTFTWRSYEEVQWVTGPSGREYDRLQSVVREIGSLNEDRRPTIAALTINFWPMFPLVNHTDARWALRYPGVWPVHAARSKALSQGRHGATDSGLRSEETGLPAPPFTQQEVVFRNQLVRDIIVHDPDVLFVRDSVVDGQFVWDALAYFRLDSAFRDWVDQYIIVTRSFDLGVYVRSSAASSSRGDPLPVYGPRRP